MAEELKIKVGADFSQATKAVDAFSNKLGSIKKPAADATNALGNLSRIAQDAPFGFIGIANNINPMLESFQRLQKETGSTGEALKAMASGLTGAGGIGLAVGVVSSLLVVFGDKLFSAGEKAKFLGTDLRDMADSADNTKKAIQELVNTLQFLNQTSALKIQIGGGNDVKVIQQQIRNLDATMDEIFNSRTILKDQINEAIKREVNAGSADEATQAVAAQKALNEALMDGIKQESDLRKQRIVMELQARLEQKKIDDQAAKDARKGPKPQFNFFDQFFDVKPDKARVEQQITAMAKLATDFAAKHQNLFEGLTPILLATSDQKAKAAGMKFWTAFQKGAVVLKQQPITAKDLGLIPEVRPDEAKQFLESFTKASEATRDKQNGIFGAGDLALGEKMFKRWQELGGRIAIPTLEQMIAKANTLADTISGVVTPAFQGFFDNLLDGKNAIQGFFQGLASGLKSLLGKMAAALAQALALKAVFSILFPGSSIAQASIGKLFGKLLGLADGGVVFGKTAALIGEGRGTNRSNPEVVAPLDKLKDLLGGVGGGYQLSVSELRLSGKDLIAAIAVNQRSQNRRF